jgi:hypothetical protein
MQDAVRVSYLEGADVIISLIILAVGVFWMTAMLLCLGLARAAAAGDAALSGIGRLDPEPTARPAAVDDIPALVLTA